MLIVIDDFSKATKDLFVQPDDKPFIAIFFIFIFWLVILLIWLFLLALLVKLILGFLYCLGSIILGWRANNGGNRGDVIVNNALPENRNTIRNTNQNDIDINTGTIEEERKV